MGAHVHKLSELNEEGRTAVCAHCGPVRVKRTGSVAVWKCALAIRSRKKAPHRRYVKDFCENPFCTATILHPCQLDVDHIDGDNNNNDPSNLMTLCSNCHRMKTYINQDWEKKNPLVS